MKRFAVKEMRNTLVFVLLVIAIGAIYFFAESEGVSALAVLIFSGLKFALVSLEFMEVRKAHPAYGLWLLFLFLAFALGALILV